jgi:hypothetical protein
MQPILARLREPSSWAGIASLLALFGVNVPSATMQAIAGAGAAVAGLAAVVMREKG